MNDNGTVFEHTDADGDQIEVSPRRDGKSVLVAVQEKAGYYAVASVLAETLADALNGYVEREEAHVELGGITMTQSQFDAATFPYREGAASNATYLRDLQRRVFENSRDHGFYEDAPTDTGPARDWYVGNKLMLIEGEVAEAHEEIRKGVDPRETYYLDGAGEPPLPAFLEHARASGALLKPEGVPSELADTVIRVLDLAEYLGIDLAAAIEEKHAYNVSRPHKHGKRF